MAQKKTFETIDVSDVGPFTIEDDGTECMRVSQNGFSLYGKGFSTDDVGYQFVDKFEPRNNRDWIDITFSDYNIDSGREILRVVGTVRPDVNNEQLRAQVYVDGSLQTSQEYRTVRTRMRSFDGHADEAEHDEKGHIPIGDYWGWNASHYIDLTVWRRGIGFRTLGRRHSNQGGDRCFTVGNAGFQQRTMIDGIRLYFPSGFAGTSEQHLGVYKERTRFRQWMDE